MPFIKTIGESEATGTIKEVYRKRVSQNTGKVSNIAKIFSLRPDLLEAQHLFPRTMLDQLREVIINGGTHE